MVTKRPTTMEMAYFMNRSVLLTSDFGATLQITSTLRGTATYTMTITTMRSGRRRRAGVARRKVLLHQQRQRRRLQQPRSHPQSERAHVRPSRTPLKERFTLHTTISQTKHTIEMGVGIFIIFSYTHLLHLLLTKITLYTTLETTQAHSHTHHFTQIHIIMII